MGFIAILLYNYWVLLLFSYITIGFYCIIGYYLDSVDGRKHKALSEAACQGHIEVIQYLLSIGADPNSLNDTGRSPLWRAAFNGHIEVCDVGFIKFSGV